MEVGSEPIFSESVLLFPFLFPHESANNSNVNIKNIFFIRLFPPHLKKIISQRDKIPPIIKILF